jgi:hypothetical protein
LSKAFAAWVLQAPEGRAEFVALASEADKRKGASQDFHTVAILGFAADAGLVFERQIQTLKQGLRRLAGRSPMVNGVPMAFSTDAVGILGVALGTAFAADLELAGAVALWAARFLKASYERDRASDWHRCLFAAADRKIGSLLKLSIPNSIASADVRIALLARGLIDCDDTQVRQDTAHVLDLVTQELLPDDLDSEQAALRLAALEWAMRTGAQQEDRANGAQETSALPDVNGDTAPRKKRGRPTVIPDDLKRKALSVKGGKARAQIIYGTKYPTPQQKKNVSAILRHFQSTHSASK